MLLTVRSTMPIATTTTAITTTITAATTMLDDFFSRALIAGIGLALVAGPLGCFVVWRRMAYFGDTMAHSALLGVALALMASINLTLGVFAVAALVAGALILLQRQATLSTDALLGILSHSTLAVGLVLVGFLTTVRVDLMGFLFGDILSVSVTDIAIIYGGGAAILGVLLLGWRPLLAATVSPELAEAEGLRPEASRIVLMILMASVIAIAMKLVGVLLITSLLIIPAATARRLSNSPEMMAVVAAGLGVLAVVGGLHGSLTWDTASGPSIVVMALVVFVLSLLVPVGRLFGRKDGHGAFS
jgi:zinc transport system permease protein